MIESIVIESLNRKLNLIKDTLDERGRRYWAACEALELGHGEIQAVVQATGLGEQQFSF